MTPSGDCLIEDAAARLYTVATGVHGPRNAHIHGLGRAKAAMSDITILIVDDEPGVRYMCEAALTHNGYRVVSGGTGSTLPV